MALYSLFLLREGKLVGNIARHCADDLHALEAAYTLCADHAVEVWHGDRLVARVPVNVRDPNPV